MPASQAERSKAARIRKAVLSGAATADQMTWLESYDAHTAPVVPPHARPATRREVVSTATDSRFANGENAPAVTNGQATAADNVPEGHVVIDFGAPQAPSQSTAMVIAHDTSTCPAGPDCPRCRAVKGAIVCGTTGERVWPKMTEEGARGMAAMLLGGIALIARMFGKNIVPSEAEIIQTGKALRETIYQRAGALGAHDDFYALGFALLAFGARAYNAPPIQKKAPNA